MSEPLLKIALSAGYGKEKVLQHVELSINLGERLGLVGTSGAGKSTLLLAVLGLLPWRNGWVRGEVLLNGVNLLALPEREARKRRGRVIALVPQSPLTALNGALSLQTHFTEAWRAHDGRREMLKARVAELLSRVHLPGDDHFLKRKPGEISVGQAQRITIALALLHKPQLIVADEPTSALDPVTQGETIALLREISESDGTALLYISHDLLSVLQLCHSVALLHQGSIAETTSVSAIGWETHHPAMRALLRTLPAPIDVLLKHVERERESFTNDSDLSTLPSSLEAYNLGAMVGDLISK